MATEVIPKGNSLKAQVVETPSGFSVVAKVKPGREQAIRDYGNKLEEAVRRIAPCSLR